MLAIPNNFSYTKTVAITRLNTQGKTMKIKIQNARLSFPSLYQHAVFGGESTGKFEATFILDKVEHADVIAQIQAASVALQKDVIKAKVPADKICLKDGDDGDRPEYAGKMTLKASTKKRPLVIDRDKTPLTADDNKPYSGCYVNGIITLWGQNNNFGKRVNAQLDGVQFWNDGEPFGDAGIGADEFDAFGDDDAF
jgi:hypothetical protein